jgi:hypoxanthine-DNA glycosylase
MSKPLKNMEPVGQGSVEQGFPPAGDKSAPRLLVLGSFPSIRSKEKGEYYGHPRNHFWPMLTAFAIERGIALPPGSLDDYSAKIALASNLRLLIWDMVQSCRRQTSADGELEIVALNDIRHLLGQYPSIRWVGLNGALAASLFMRHVVLAEHRTRARKALRVAGGRIGIEIGGQTRSIMYLPSTSPVPSRRFRSSIDKQHIWFEFLGA